MRRGNRNSTAAAAEAGKLHARLIYDIGLLGAFYTAVINKTSVSTELAGTVTSAREKLVQLIENFHQ